MASTVEIHDRHVNHIAEFDRPPRFHVPFTLLAFSPCPFRIPRVSESSHSANTPGLRPSFSNMDLLRFSYSGLSMSRGQILLIVVSALPFIMNLLIFFILATALAESEERAHAVCQGKRPPGFLRSSLKWRPFLELSQSTPTMQKKHIRWTQKIRFFGLSWQRRRQCRL